MKITEIYKNAYNTIVEEKKKAVIEQLKKSKSKSLSFNYVLNQISKDLSNDARNYVADNELEESTKMFKSTFQMYEGDFNNQLNLVLENEIEKIYQKTPNEKDFKKFVEKIAKAEALNACSLYFSNNSSSINLMYDLGDYKQFILDKKIDPVTHYKLRTKLYPEDKNIDDKRKRKDWSKEIKETNSFLETFSDNEKKVLLKAFYRLIESNFKNNAYKNFKDLIPITEFSKLVLRLYIWPYCKTIRNFFKI